MREQTIDRAANMVTTYANVDAFLESPRAPAGIINIKEAGVPIDLLNSDKGADVTIVFFHGAIEPHFTVPVLHGLGISGGIQANRIFVSDPSLYLSEKLMLAWYAGNSRQPLQRQLTQILGKIIESHGSSRVVFFGGSGGGFAALYYAAQFPGSVALPFNPQTNIARYLPSAILDFTEHAFGIDRGHDDPLSLLPASVTTDLRSLYAKPLGVTIGYMQNLNDHTHIERHYLPFLDAVNVDTPMVVLADSWAGGHKPPPKDVLTSVLEAAASPAPILHSLSGIGFKPACNVSIGARSGTAR